DDGGGEALDRIYECLDAMDASTAEKLAAKTKDFSENTCCFEEVIPLSLQRRVEGLLLEHTDRMQLEYGNDASTTVEDSYEAEPVKRSGNPYPLVDRIKRLHDDLEVTAAKVRVTAAKQT
ncbi:hypothetical protein Tco_1139995, partial [Tanacetum coccineum]